MSLPEYLREDYKDDVLDLTQNANRKYQEIENQDGSLSFNDVTAYEQVGDMWGMIDINETNAFVNALKRTFSEQIQQLINSKSHVGMVIQSTTLNTEAKVIAQYGGTHWSKIEGRFLLGQSSSYSISSMGGASTVTLSESQLPFVQAKFDVRRAGESDTTTLVGVDNNSVSNQHAHIYEQQGATWDNTLSNLVSNRKATDVVDIYFGGNQAHENMPPYKVVYIWERTA